MPGQNERFKYHMFLIVFGVLMKNNTIALLIGVFIVVSLSVFLIGPRQIVVLSGRAASGDASTAFNLTEEVSILVSGTIDFGSGRVNANSTNSTLDSSLGKNNFYLNNITSLVGEMPSKRLTYGVFDTDRKVFVFYGGLLWGLPIPYLNDTWEFNYSTMAWTQITSASASAVPGNQGLVLSSIDYDSYAKRVIIFGGGGNGGNKNETWEYNGTNWTNLVPGASPPISQGKPMVFDSKRNVSVLFGDGAASSNATWEYNYSANTWTEKAIEAPSARSTGAGMTFVTSTGKAYLFGGKVGDDYLNDTWTYDGTSWTQLATSGAPPMNGEVFAPFYDPGRDRVLIWAVDNVTYKINSFWDFNPQDNSFHRIRDIPATSLGGFGGSAFDSSNNVTIMFVGTSSLFDGNTYSNQTWTFNYTPSGGSINGSWAPYKDYFYIENDGTVNISVNYTADTNAGQFIGGTSPSYMLKGIATEASSCTSLSTSYAEVPNSTGTPNTLCPILQYDNSKDEISAAIKLIVPNDIAGGSRTSTITFSAAKVS